MYAEVRVTPGARHERFEEGSDGRSFVVSVKEPATRNMANKRVAALLAAHFGVAPAGVHIVSGHRSRRKVFSVDTESAV